MKFIDEHRYDTIHGRAFGVEPICRVLSEHGCLIAPSTYYAAKSRPVCDRVIREAVLLTQIRRVHVDNYGCMGPQRIRPFTATLRISPQSPVVQCRRWREWEGASAHYLRLPALTPIFEWFHTRFKGRNGG